MCEARWTHDVGLVQGFRGEGERERDGQRPEPDALTGTDQRYARQSVKREILGERR